jgi:hypothetical protein|tara:strand:- start:792 stop:1190 length:399 start_codon:yes stop_codon:yes gene_type:complete
MSNKIGVLGQASTLTAATTAVYTVPSAKAAKCKIFYIVQGNSDASTDFKITVNGIVVADHTNITASNYLFSSPNAMKEGPLAALPTGVDGDTTGAPAPSEYYLSAADIVSYTLAGSNALVCSVQVVGTEIDV